MTKFKLCLLSLITFQNRQSEEIFMIWLNLLMIWSKSVIQTYQKTQTLNSFVFQTKKYSKIVLVSTVSVPLNFMKLDELRRLNFFNICILVYSRLWFTQLWESATLIMNWYQRNTGQFSENWNICWIYSSNFYIAHSTDDHCLSWGDCVAY